MEFVFLDKKTLMQKADLFCELYHSCFSDKIDSEIIKKRYIDNPYDELLMCVAVDNGKFVANYAALPYYVNIGSKRFKASLCINGMTHPQYGGRGLILETSSRLMELMKKENYAVTLGFPNYLSNGILTSKMGFQDLYEFPTMTLALTDKIQKRQLEIPVNQGFSDELVAEKNLIEIIKEPCYIKWRYQNHPTSKYYAVWASPQNWAVYKFYGDDELNIVELHSNDSASLKAVCDYIINTAIDKGCKKISTWCKTNTSQHIHLEKTGFRNEAPIRYFIVRNLSYNGDCDVFDIRNWNIQMGDDNVY